MSNGSGEGQAGGFDLKNAVSWVALIAAAGSFFYTSTVDTREQVSDIEGSISSLTSRINERPDADAVRGIIDETVQIPEAGPSVEDVQSLIDTPMAELRTEIAALDENMAALNSDVGTLSADAQAGLEEVRTEIGSVSTSFEAQLGDLQNALGAAISADEAQAVAEQAAANAIPSGAVVAFATSCPTELGWKEHEAARGRFLVATGAGTDANGEMRNFVLGIGTNDGEYAHTLTQDEMPVHRHTVDRQGPTRGIQDVPALGSDGAIIATIESELTHPAGGDAPHNNLPPYIALHFCEKL